MKLIGAGLPRTGTLTQKVALEMVGIGPCYHMVDVLGNLELVGQWRDALDGKPDWDQIFDGFESTVDWPGGFFYRELLDIYPDAKVLLSVRDPELWERSMRATVWGVYHGDSLIAHLSRAAAKVDPRWERYLELMTDLLWDSRGTLADCHHDPDGMIAAMHKHSDEVRRTVPPERLLVWDLTDGWEPLCEFLQVAVPDAPLPYLNDGRTFQDRMVEMALAMIGDWRQREQAAAGRPPSGGAPVH
jgi:hypothetical protein